MGEGDPRAGDGEGDGRLGERAGGLRRRRRSRPATSSSADVDGVVVVPQARRPTWPRLGSERVAKEEKSRARLRNGELGLDFYGLRAKLAELGVQYVDEGHRLSADPIYRLSGTPDIHLTSS